MLLIEINWYYIRLNWLSGALAGVGGFRFHRARAGDGRTPVSPVGDAVGLGFDFEQGVGWFSLRLTWSGPWSYHCIGRVSLKLLTRVSSLSFFETDLGLSSRHGVPACQSTGMYCMARRALAIIIFIMMVMISIIMVRNCNNAATTTTITTTTTTTTTTTSNDTTPGQIQKSCRSICCLSEILRHLD